MTRTRVLLAAALASLAVMAGCSDDADPKPAPEQAPPVALTLEDVEAEDEGTPERAVLELWYDGVLGSAPDIVGDYHSRVREEIGEPEIAGAYDQQRQFMQNAEVEIVDTRDASGGGTRVVVELKPPNAQRSIETFVLQREDGEWVITYDTFLVRALKAFAESQVDPVPADQPSSRALGAGQDIAQRYRSLFLEQ